MSKTGTKVVKFVVDGIEYTGTLETSREDEVDVVGITPPCNGDDAATVPKGALEMLDQGYDVSSKFIHDWLIFHGGDNPLGCEIAIHKSMVGRHYDIADSSCPDPEDHISRFGPDSLRMSMTSIDDMHFDVHHVYTLWRDGFLNDKCFGIFADPDRKPMAQAVELIEDLIQSVRTLQGMCGWEPPEDSDHAAWLGCEVVANAAQNFVDSLRPQEGGE